MSFNAYASNLPMFQFFELSKFASFFFFFLFSFLWHNHHFDHNYNSKLSMTRKSILVYLISTLILWFPPFSHSFQHFSVSYHICIWIYCANTNQSTCISFPITVVANAYQSCPDIELLFGSVGWHDFDINVTHNANWVFNHRQWSHISLSMFIHIGPEQV